MTWTAVASSVRSQVAHATAAAGPGHGLALAQPGSRLPAAIYANALAAGISRGFVVASGIALAALIIAVVTIRVRARGPGRREHSASDGAGQRAQDPPDPAGARG